MDSQSTSWGNTTFVDIAISNDYLKNTSGTSLDFNAQHWTLQLASIVNANDHGAINYDVGGGKTPDDLLTAGWPTGMTLVQLGAFSARYSDRRMLVEWKTLAETDAAGFHVWRADEPSGDFRRLTPSMIEAQGGPFQPADYAFEDASVRPGRTYYYKLEDIDMSGQTSFHGPIIALAGEIVPRAPDDGYDASPSNPPAFSWDGGGYEAFKLEISADRAFAGEILALPAGTRAFWINGQRYAPSSREWSQAVALGRRSGIVYWRIHGLSTTGAEGVSGVRRLKIR